MTLIIFIPVMGNDSQTDAVKTPMKKGSRERERRLEETGWMRGGKRAF